MATPTKVYPLASTPNGQPIGGLPGVPHVTTEVATKAEADALVATGHFTLNPNDSGRVPAADAPAQPDTTDKE